MSSIMPVAQYVRMSTEHQRYSIAHQGVANAAYAAGRGYQIIKTYEDAGISGLRVDKREGLKALLRDVLGRTEPRFGIVLVFDVSRWGRFQDPDESAHYEFLCRGCGVQIEYTAEIFQNNNDLPSVLLKQMKRAMAAEFSRDLGRRVSRAKGIYGGKGYWMGGPAPYGLQRCAISANGSETLLAAEEWKSMSHLRTVLVPGDAEEIATVRQIFDQFAVRRISSRMIAQSLNASGSDYQGRPWNGDRVRRILNCELYTGVLLVGRSASCLGAFTRKPPSEWTRVPGAIDPIVTETVFQRARTLLRRSLHRGLTDDRLLSKLANALKVQGALNERIVRLHTGHDKSVYRRRFGSLFEAYRLVGYAPSAEQSRQSELAKAWHKRAGVGISNEEILTHLRRLLQEHGYLTASLMRQDPACPSAETVAARFGSLAAVYAELGYEPTSSRQAAALRRRDPDHARTTTACLVLAELDASARLGAVRNGEPRPHNEVPG
jgi:DNA invertase Pin-like site-specific DNA recombinase